ncbi:MAG: hypothetical protein M3328_14530 [Chloroflexota bacterium]|nr:hypothetical protein [Chloroflexota bacterium]
MPTLRVRWWEPASIFLVTLAVLALFAPRVMTYLNPVTGDEPFYLMTAISIWEDGDLNECNNYRQLDEARFHPAFYSATGLYFAWLDYPADWRGWPSTPFPLTPHAAQLVPKSRMCASTDPTEPLPVNGTRNELYSKHGLGLSLLVLPAFVAGGRELVVYFLVAVGALLAANVYLLARETARQMWPALLTWVAFAFTVPQLPYSYLIFPELPAALFVVYAFRRIRLWDNNGLQIAATGASIAFLPWLHYRFIPVSAALFIYFAYSALKRQTPHRLLAFSTVVGQSAVSAGLLMLFFYHRYRQVFPNASDHAGSSDLDGTLRGAAGLFLDVQWGLFVATPVYILAIVGIVLMGAFRSYRRDLLWLALVFVPYFGVIANYAQFWGEWCPPARYLASILPLLAMPFSLTLDRIRNWAYLAIYGILLVISLAVVAGYLYQPQWMYHHPDGYNLNHVIIKGLPLVLRQLPREMQHVIDPNDINAALPSFVIPYFYYLQNKGYGDLTTSIAWSKSVGPGIVIAAIVAFSLALAWWSNPGRRWLRRRIKQEEAPLGALPSTADDPVLTRADQPDDMGVLARPVGTTAQDRHDEIHPTLRG